MGKDHLHNWNIFLKIYVQSLDDHVGRLTIHAGYIMAEYKIKEDASVIAIYVNLFKYMEATMRRERISSNANVLYLSEQFLISMISPNGLIAFPHTNYYCCTPWQTLGRSLSVAL